VDIKNFKNIATQLPPHIAVLMRGPTGVGKSHLAKAAADEMGMPYIDVRGSTMSEGDVGGYPDVEGMKTSGVMTFCMPAWFVRACREPVVLMLDELNRSLPGVQQSFFQLVLDRELGNDKDGNPYRLHPETRVFAAVNAGAEYDVNDMDPALLRRFWTIDLDPTHGDWIDWATDVGLDRVLVDFIRQNPMHLRVDPSEVEPGTVCPNPASWHRLEQSLAHMGIAPAVIAGNPNDLIYSVSRGFVGTEAAIAFSEFVQEYASVVSAEDVLDRWKDVADNVGEFNAEGNTALIDKLAVHFEEGTWKAKQAKNVKLFADGLSDELVVYMWNQFLGTKNVPNIQTIHKLLGTRVLDAVKASRDVAKS
jgi:hypothetical protein